jgi:C_GCAxxG_C_C family probable redox protein
MDKEKIFEKAYRLGVVYESRATDCCQSTIAAIQDALGCQNNDILRAGCPLCGGLGFSYKGTCGALTGAAMVIGQLYGRTREEFDIDAKRMIDDPEFDYFAATKGWQLAREVYELFIIEYGSWICYDISDIKLGRIEKEELIRSDSPACSHIKRINPSHTEEGCGSVVGNAAKWATQIILREGIPGN